MSGNYNQEVRDAFPTASPLWGPRHSSTRIGLNWPRIDVFKLLKVTMLKEVKKGTRTRSQKIETINKETDL